MIAEAQQARKENTAMAGMTKKDLEEMVDQVYIIADDALTPKTTRGEAIDALTKIYELTCPDDEDEEDDDADSDDEEDDE